MKRSKVGRWFDSLSVRVAFLFEIDGGVVPTNEQVSSAVGQKSNVKALASSRTGMPCVRGGNVKSPCPEYGLPLPRELPIPRDVVPRRSPT